MFGGKGLQQVLWTTVELPIGYTTWAYVEESDAGNRLFCFCTCRQEWTLIWERGQTPNFPCTSHCQGSSIFCRTWTAMNRSLILLRKLFSKSLHYTLFQNVLDLLKSLQSLASQLGGAFRIRTPQCCWNLQLRRVKELCKERQGCELPMRALAFQFLFFCPSSAVKIWSFDILVWKSLFLETEVAHLMVRWLTLWPGLKFLSSSRFGANRVLGQPLQWINVSRYPDRPEFYLSFATAMNVLFFCIPKNFQRLLEVTAYCLALWQSLQVLGSLMFFETKPANRMLQTAGCRRGLPVNDKGRNHDIHGLTLVMQSKFWRILTRSCSFCALRFLWYSQLFLLKEAASVYFLKGTAWRSPKLVRWDDGADGSKTPHLFLQRWTGVLRLVEASKVLVEHLQEMRSAYQRFWCFLTMASGFRWQNAQICQVWSIGFGAIAAGNYDRFLTFWRIPYGFCLSALSFNFLRISLVLFSFNHLETSKKSSVLFRFMPKPQVWWSQVSWLMADSNVRGLDLELFRAHGWAAWEAKWYQSRSPSQEAIVKMKAVTRCALGPTICNDSWQLCPRVRLGYSTYFMSSFMPQPHDFWSVDS